MRFSTALGCLLQEFGSYSKEFEVNAAVSRADYAADMYIYVVAS